MSRGLEANSKSSERGDFVVVVGGEDEYLMYVWKEDWDLRLTGSCTLVYDQLNTHAEL